MTAHDIAFLLDIPRKETDLCLRELVADGSIRVDGELYHMSRSLSEAQLAKIGGSERPDPTAVAQR